MKQSLSAAGLFAGIGGIELGLQQSGIETKLLCENWEPAKAVLEHRFPEIELVDDVTKVERLPDVELVAAGFPCTDLSQAGRTKGIQGEASGLVGEVFKLLRDRRAPLVLLENVRNMLVLDKGEAMRYLVGELESLGYQWAYRLVDSRFTGVPQRRQRVIMLASTEIDPKAVLFSDDVGAPEDDELYNEDLYGFYWTEGLRGLGWARDAVPTLKGGSSIGIPSPPAIWNREAQPGRRIVTPTIEQAEQLQGFAKGWTSAANEVSRRKGDRWKLVGNAVTVGVSRWVGERLMRPGIPMIEAEERVSGSRWPTAAYGMDGKVWAVESSLWPRQENYWHLSRLVRVELAPPLSARAAAGFYSRAQRSSLRFQPGFLDDVALHAEYMAAERAVA